MKHTDSAGMHGMWLPTDGQIVNGDICISSLAHGEQREKRKKFNSSKLLIIDAHFRLI